MSRPKISQTERRACWYLTFSRGQGDPRCPICRKNRLPALEEAAWQAGHIKAHAEGGPDTADNLVPICPKCNCKQGAENMKHYVNRVHPCIAPIFHAILSLRNINNLNDCYPIEHKMRSYVYLNPEFYMVNTWGPMDRRRYYCTCGSLFSEHCVNTLTNEVISWGEPRQDDFDERKQIIMEHYPHLVEDFSGLV